MRRLALTLMAAALVAMPASAALKQGAKAPMFVTQGAMAGKVTKVDLKAELKRGPVVLYFFPAAFTSGCNAEAKAFADQLDQFKAAGATVIGMSADDVPTLQRFSNEHCAGKFRVATASPALVKQFDVALGREMNGRAITNRTSYVIAPDGSILLSHTDMSPMSHIRETLAAAKRYRASRG